MPLGGGTAAGYLGVAPGLAGLNASRERSRRSGERLLVDPPPFQEGVAHWRDWVESPGWTVDRSYNGAMAPRSDERAEVWESSAKRGIVT